MGGVMSRAREPATPAVITYSVDGGAAVQEEFDFIVVACDPRNLNISDRTAFEEQVNSRLTSHTFHTSLFSADRPNREEMVPANLPPNGPPHTNYCVRFDPEALERMDGSVYGFRDEVMARDANFQPSSTKTTWAVTYQLENKPLIGRNKDDVEKTLNEARDKEIKENIWVDWDATRMPEKEITVDYFAHFLQPDLKNGLPWKLVKEQGKNKTLYIASFTCFESVLHCYLYQNMLMNRDDVQDAFPTDKKARIAVIGAGPAGLLFASQHLAVKGYTNFTIFESTDRYGGKTQTEYQPIPANPTEPKLPCELGTCYLSPAYFPLYDIFEKYNVGDVLALDRSSNAFRSIIDSTVAENEQERLDGVEYNSWAGYRKNDYATPAIGQQRILRGTVLFILYHVCAMGMDPEDPMPERKPSVTRVVSNVASIIKWIVTNLDDVRDIVDVESFSLSKLLQGVLNRGGVLKNADDAMKEDCELLSKEVEKVDLDIDLHDIMRLFSVDLFKKTFGEFLDDLDIGDLKPTLVYAYQVQGYGTLSRIPAYYGLIWITPYVFLNQILGEIIPAEPGSERARRGTVNVMSKGWLNVWKSIVDKDLPESRFKYKAHISGIDRKLSA